MTLFYALPYRLQVWINRLLRRPTQPPQRNQASIVPAETIAGNALVMVISIMTFLASLSIGAVDIVRQTAQGWEAQVSREVTIQIMPRGGRDIDSDVATAQRIAANTAGISTVRPYSEAEISKLLQPWLGTGFSLENLPTPRLLVLQLDESVNVDWEALRQGLAQDVPSASLDDHRVWLEHLQAVGRNFVMGGIFILALVMAATVLCVLFATRAAMSGNSDIVDVLHIIGARDSFIARAFQHRFLVFGLKGGLIGGGLGILCFLMLRWFWGRSSRVPDGTEMLFGSTQISLNGYLGVIIALAFIALLTAFTSRIVVMGHLRHIP
jgi:cell division transport system permease protein